MHSKYDKVFALFRGRYVDKLIEFYGGNPTYRNPDFEDVEVTRILWTARLLYYTKIFRYAGRKLRARIRVKIEARTTRIFQWMRQQASWMEASKPLDKSDTKE